MRGTSELTTNTVRLQVLIGDYLQARSQSMDIFECRFLIFTALKRWILQRKQN